MKPFDLYEFQVVMYHLQREESQAHIVVNYLKSRGKTQRNNVPAADVQERVISYLSDLKVIMGKLGYRELDTHFKRVFSHFEIDGGIKYHHLEDQLRGLRESVQDYIRDRVFFFIDDPQQYRSRYPFGGSVARNFPLIRVDALEASKCLALGRNTASAFHSIRCLEAGLRAVHACLGLPVPNTGSAFNWGILLRDVKLEMDLRWKAARDRFSGDGKLFDEIYGLLDGMKDPYRNATMHIENKYTAAQARRIFVMVEDIMVKIASRMDEEGYPRA